MNISNNNFQFLNNISRIFTYFFTTCISTKNFKQLFSVFKYMLKRILKLYSYQMDTVFEKRCSLIQLPEKGKFYLLQSRCKMHHLQWLHPVCSKSMLHQWWPQWVCKEIAER